MDGRVGGREGGRERGWRGSESKKSKARILRLHSQEKQALLHTKTRSLSKARKKAEIADGGGRGRAPELWGTCVNAGTRPLPSATLKRNS